MIIIHQYTNGEHWTTAILNLASTKLKFSFRNTAISGHCSANRVANEDGKRREASFTITRSS